MWHERLLAFRYQRLGGISPVTRDFIDPEMAWPQITALGSVTRGAGFELRERPAAHPEYLDDLQWIAEPLRQRALAWTDTLGSTASLTVSWKRAARGC